MVDVAGPSSKSDASLAESALLSEESLESDFRRAANSLGLGFEGAAVAPSEVVAIDVCFDVWF